jgi:hypothetical protein
MSDARNRDKIEELFTILMIVEIKPNEKTFIYYVLFSLDVRRLEKTFNSII